MNRDIVIQILKAIPNYRKRGKGNRVNKVFSRNSLWGKLSRRKVYKTTNVGFSTNIIQQELYNFFYSKEKIPNTPESGELKKKLQKWINQRVKRTIADGQ